MNQFARLAPKCQAAPASSGCLGLWLDVEVLAERYEALAVLSPFEDDLPEETEETEEETSDELPF